MENLAGNKVERGKENIKKKKKPQKRDCQVPHNTQLNFLLFIEEVNKTWKYPVIPSVVITAFTVAMGSIHRQQQDLQGCQD